VPIEICNAFASQCSPDWEGLSAVATAVAAGLALFIPVWQRRKDREETQDALGYSLLLKMIKVHSDTNNLWDHVLEQREMAKQAGGPPDTWQFFRATSNSPTGVKFTSDELALLFSLKNDETFNRILSFDEVHAGYIENFRFYAQKREALTDMLPSGNLNGAIGTIALNATQFAQLAPYAKQLDMFLEDLIADLEKKVVQSREALMQLKHLLISGLGMKFKLELP